MTTEKSIPCETEDRYRFITSYRLKIRLTNGVSGRDEDLVGEAYYVVFNHQGQKICDGQLDSEGCAELEKLPRLVRVEFPDFFDVKLLDDENRIESQQKEPVVEEHLFESEPVDTVPPEEIAFANFFTEIDTIEDDDFQDHSDLTDSLPVIIFEEDDDINEENSQTLFGCDDEGIILSPVKQAEEHGIDWYSTNLNEVDCKVHKEAHFALLEHISVEVFEPNGDPYSGDFVLKKMTGEILRRGSYNGKNIKHMNVGIGDYQLELDSRTIVIGSDPDINSYSPFFLGNLEENLEN